VIVYLVPFRSYCSLLFKFWILSVFEPLFRGLGTTYDDHLGLIGKHVVDCPLVLIRPPDVSREVLKFYPWTFFSFLSIYRAVNGHQMYFGASVVGKASTIGIEISPLIFIKGQKVQNLASFSTSLSIEPLAFENAARYPNAETNFLCRNDRPMSSPSLVKLGPRTPENRLSVVPHP